MRSAKKLHSVRGESCPRSASRKSAADSSVTAKALLASTATEHMPASRAASMDAGLAPSTAQRAGARSNRSAASSSAVPPPAVLHTSADECEEEEEEGCDNDEDDEREDFDSEGSSQKKDERPAALRSARVRGSGSALTTATGICRRNVFLKKLKTKFEKCGQITKLAAYFA